MNFENGFEVNPSLVSNFQMDEVATEGFLGDFINNVFSFGKIEETSKVEALTEFRNMLTDSKNLFGKNPEKAQFPLTFQIVKVDEKRGIISIQNINFRLLFQHIKDTYGEKKLDSIFYRTYKEGDIRLYNKKRLTRGQMKITSLMSPIFFALELSILFSQLYAKYKLKSYRVIANEIYEKTWLSKADRAVVSKPDIEYAKSMLAPRYALKKHQVEFLQAYPGWKAKLNLRGVYLAFDQGLGKTLTAMSLALATHMDKIYVVCPNTLVRNWYDEIMDYYEGRVIPFDCRNGGSGKNAQVFITNNESIKNILPYIDTNCRTMLIVDEGHNFRNIRSSRVQELKELREKLRPNEVLPMSGTPLKATPAELVPAFMLLDPTFSDVAAEMYSKCFDFDNYAAMEIVTSRLGKMIYRKLKSEVLELPEKTIEDLELQIGDAAPYLMTTIREDVMKHYWEIAPSVLSENEVIIEKFQNLVNEYSTAGTTRTKWYLMKICEAANPRNEFTVEQMHEIDTENVLTFLDKFVISNPNFPRSEIKNLKDYESKLIHFDRVIKGRAIGMVYPPRRTAVFNALWDENEKLFIDMINQNIKKTVIFSQFFGTVKHIADRLNRNGIPTVMINGTVTNQTRAQQIHRFRDDDRIRVIIATSQTMGTGVTLVEASQMFFFGPPWRSADYDQCCDRIYRIGQDVDVHIYNVLLNTSTMNISTRMDKILKWSSDMFHAAIDDTVVAAESLVALESSYVDKFHEDVWNSGMKKGVTGLKDYSQYMIPATEGDGAVVAGFAAIPFAILGIGIHMMNKKAKNEKKKQKQDVMTYLETKKVNNEAGAIRYAHITEDKAKRLTQQHTSKVIGDKRIRMGLDDSIRKELIRNRTNYEKFARNDPNMILPGYIHLDPSDIKLKMSVKDDRIYFIDPNSPLIVQIFREEDNDDNAPEILNSMLEPICENIAKAVIEKVQQDLKEDYENGIFYVKYVDVMNSDEIIPYLEVGTNLPNLMKIK